MSLKKRFIALLLAVLMLVSLCGCDPMSLLPSDYDMSKLERTFSGVDISRDETITFDQIEYSRPDIDALKQLGADIEALLDEHASRKEVVSSLDDFIEMYDHFRTMATLACIYYDLDVNDEYYAEEYSYCNSMWGEVWRIFDDTMLACSNSHMCAFLDANYFGGLLEDSYSIEGGYVPDDELVELQTKESELLYDYRKLINDIYASESYDIYEELSESAAGIYIELVKLRRGIAEKSGYDSYIDYAYDNFGREYGPDDLDEYAAAVKQKLVPLYKELSAAGAFDNMYYDLRQFSRSDTLTVLSAAAKKMGEGVYEPMQFMKSSGLYDISGSDSKRDSSYVTYLDDYDVPYLFSKTYGYSDDVLTVGHEFGHFVDYYINYGFDMSNDSAEMFSQGMEYMLLQYIDDKDLAAELTKFKMLDALYLYVTQLSFNEFEERIYELSDEELTVENVNSIYAGIADEYGYADDYDTDLLPYLWIDVSHLFEQPFYTISYCVSDSAAFELYELELDKSGRGLGAYLSLIDLSDEYGFLDLLENQGLPSPIAADTIGRIAETLRSRIAA